MNFSIGFFQLFQGDPPIPTRGVDPSLLVLTDCQDGAGCTQGGCAPGFCSAPQWSTLGPIQLAEHIAAAFRPDTFIMNSGLWGPASSFASPERIRQLDIVTKHLRNAGVRELIWKTTTATTDAEHPAHAEYALLLPALTAHHPPWRIFDAHAITQPLADGVLSGAFSRSDVYWAGGHFQPQVYRGLNEALLIDLLRGCDLCDS